MCVRVVGREVRRIDALEKAFGRARYVNDFSLPNMLHAAVVYPGVAHGVLRSVDTSEAERVPGVVKVATYKDVPNNEMGIVTKDMHVLVPVGGKVRFEADPIALVAAESKEAAEEAAKLVKFEIEELPVVLTICLLYTSPSPRD
jgi:CO/xanthine dehydrogenase Mo-binding subunit